MSRRKGKGFTLIELLVAVAVVAILASVAYPTYREQMRKSRRAEGQGLLLDTAQALEKCRMMYGLYNATDGAGANLCRVLTNVTSTAISSAEGYYLVSALGAPSTTAYSLQAVPQLSDPRCGTLILTQNGDRCVDKGDGAGVQCLSTGSASAQECW